jgi:hypothetical protein
MFPRTFVGFANIAYISCCATTLEVTIFFVPAFRVVAKLVSWYTAVLIVFLYCYRGAVNLLLFVGISDIYLMRLTERCLITITYLAGYVSAEVYAAT